MITDENLTRVLQSGELATVSYGSELTLVSCKILKIQDSAANFQDFAGRIFFEFSRFCRNDLEIQDFAGRILNFQDFAGRILNIIQE